MKFGVSLINAFSSIEWNKNTPLRKGLEGIGVNFPVRDKEYYFFRIEYQIELLIHFYFEMFF